MAWGRRVCIFWKFFGVGGLRGVKLQSENALGSAQVAPFWWGVCTSCNLVCLLRVADLLSLTSCVRTYEWLLICHWANDAILSLLREGGLRNDAAGAALWRTRPYECAIDVCQLLTMVIADVCRELSFHLYWFATNGGFVRFDNVVNRMETFERETTYE